MNDWAPARDEPLRDRRRYRARYRDAGRTVPIRSQHVEHEKVDLEAKLAQFDEQWSPKLVGKLNGREIKLAKMEDEFVWHHHAADELFLVLDGHLTIELREGSVDLGEGEFFIVPRGVEHKPVADGEAHVLLFEPAETRNTGNVANERTSDVESL